MPLLLPPILLYYPYILIVRVYCDIWLDQVRYCYIYSWTTAHTHTHKHVTTLNRECRLQLDGFLPLYQLTLNEIRCFIAVLQKLYLFNLALLYNGLIPCNIMAISALLPLIAEIKTLLSHNFKTCRKQTAIIFGIRCFIAVL